MSLIITITDAGRAEIVNAENTGTGPVLITEIGFGTGQYAPAPTQTALQAETKRISTLSGQVVAPDTIHVTVQDASADAYNVGEFGLYTDSGTLFAVFSQQAAAGWIIEKSSVLTLLLATDIIFSNINAASLAFGDVSFLNPPASETVQGVVELATAAEVQAGTDTVRAVTPAGLAAAGATKLRTPRTLTIGNTGKSFDGSSDQSWSLDEIGAAGFAILASGTDLNTVVAPGFYRLTDTQGNAPAEVVHGQLIVARGGGDTILQIVTGYSNGEIYWRQGNHVNNAYGSLNPWHRFFHSGNLNPATYAPPGMVAYFAINTAPPGWLKANGAAVSRTTYANLFAAIGTTFGTGDGSTTFNLPDLRGEFLRGWDDSRWVDSGRGFGSWQNHAIQNHEHSYSKANFYNTNSGNLDRGNVDSYNGYTNANTGYMVTGNIAAETRPRNIALLACIKY